MRQDKEVKEIDEVKEIKEWRTPTRTGRLGDVVVDKSRPKVSYDT